MSLGFRWLQRVGSMALLIAIEQLSCTPEASAVRPFVTDDARVVDKGQLGVETYAGLTMSQANKPAIEVRSLQGIGLTDRFELTVGGFGFTYQDGQANPLDLLIQPKYVLYRSFGIIPSVSVSAASLFPLSGNKQHWDSYSMAQISWFLFTPEDGSDPYDNGLAIHLNFGTKNRYDAGPTTFQSKFFWAGGFEAITFSRELRFLGEVFNGDPFGFEEKFPAFQTGFRWYKAPDLQWDVVFRGVRNTSEDVRLAAGGGGSTDWNFTIQLGLRVILDVFD